MRLSTNLSDIKNPYILWGLRVIPSRILKTSVKAFSSFRQAEYSADISVLETLRGRCELFSYKNTNLYLFLKSGFTKGCVNKVNEIGNVTLASFKDMLA